MVGLQNTHAAGWEYHQGGRERLKKVPKPQGHQQGQAGTDVFGGGVQHGKTGHREQTKADSPQYLVRFKGH
jgi:hypothetical protein